MSSLVVEQTWLVLVDLLTDLKNKGIDVPTSINENMRLLRTSINFYKADTTHPDMMKELKRINDSTNSIQDPLLSLAQDVSEEYYGEWLEKLKKVSQGEEIYKTSKTKSRFMVGAPPGFNAARVTLKEPLAEERVQDIAEDNNLIIEFVEDNVIAIYGHGDNVKNGLKKIGSFFKDY
ncbi:MAG: DUF2096 domain-containing protein [Euryarchaeota archaeon]|nr:DUF2096 domain-containing protein [Euryarchaeota archaeon]MBU4607122.1 DUF2096 domain-containing protein [Euryarchaeota archaeon]MBV1729092.1 DUF2096 domain-containing protein [Methanobacterium sp.]MBV1755037.1 DUF2096 domain-containing protein [Methanobacterium sp.]